MAVGKRLRFEVLKRDGFRCRYCGKKGDAKGLHADHVVPRSKGGKDEASNLVAACIDCNTGKSDVPLSVVAVEGTALDRVVDHGLWLARLDADQVRELDENREFTNADLLEEAFPFPMEIPEGAMW